LRKTILHIIQDLNRGGAETILVTTVKELGEYNNIVVTLFEGNQFGNDFKADHFYCLRIKHLLLLPLYAFRLRRIIKIHKVDLVHSRLYWATFLARIATPQKVPLVTTIHSYIAGSVEYKKWIIRWLERFTYRFHKTTMLADSKGALDEYFDFLDLKPYRAISPFTFVDTRIFQNSSPVRPIPGERLMMVAVGRLTIQKNHQYLVEAFRLLQNENIELHIYGMGECYEKLQEQIEHYQVPIILKGQVSNIPEVISSYHLFIMPSLYEGFSLAVLEAMAMRMPLLLSDIASFREQCAETAVYFNLADPSDFALKLRSLINDPNRQELLGQAAHKRVLDNFTLEHHMKTIRTIYASVLADS
jgi:glycosyltransferase involved in cell wall biosynthesis